MGGAEGIRTPDPLTASHLPRIPAGPGSSPFVAPAWGFAEPSPRSIPASPDKIAGIRDQNVISRILFKRRAQPLSARSVWAGHGSHGRVGRFNPQQGPGGGAEGIRTPETLDCQFKEPITNWSRPVIGNHRIEGCTRGLRRDCPSPSQQVMSGFQSDSGRIVDANLDDASQCLVGQVLLCHV